MIASSPSTSPQLSSAVPLRGVTQEEIDTFRRDGVVILKQIIPRDWMELLSGSLTEVFDRDDKEAYKEGYRTDMTAAAKEFKANGSVLVEDGSGMQDHSPARFLTEVDAGRWHEGLGHFEREGPLVQVVQQLLGCNELQFYMDHCFMVGLYLFLS